VISQQWYASFPWYDLPEMHAATDRLWQAMHTVLAKAGVDDLPESLDRTRPHGTDFDGDCFFTQTCGYPLFTTARGHFAVLGAPRYRVPGCSGSLHRSYIVVRDTPAVRGLSDLRGTRFAINEGDSNSGMNLPRALFAPLAQNGRFFGSTVVSGSHAASAELVSAGAADSAAIDCVTFALLKRYRPAAVQQLRVIAETASTPTPPFVTSFRTSASHIAALRSSLSDFMSNTAFAPIREALLLDGIDFCNEDAYRIVMEYERDAARLGYPVLA
jgi:ABC-type phosphate/phosphonate transport system substrate-binding protein